MSNQAQTWAIGQKTGSPSAKTVLWSVSNYANQHWCAWISQAILVEESEQSVDSVQRRMRDLEVLGLLRRIPLHFSGRKTVDFIILAPSPWFRAPLDDIKPLLPAGCTIDPKWASLHAAADCGHAETGTAPPTLPQALPQIAPPATALVRQQEPSREPKNNNLSQSFTTPVREGERENLDEDREGFDALASIWPMKDKLAEARTTWATLSADDRSGAAAYAPVFLAEMQGKRRFIEALSTFLKGQAWRVAPKPVVWVELKPMSRAFWAYVWRKFAKGEPIGFLIAEALRGKGRTVPEGDAPTAEEEAALVPVKVDGDGFVLWRDRVGPDLKRPDSVPVIWCPSEYPPERRAAS